VQFCADKGLYRLFLNCGNNLVTSWSVPAMPGHYSVRIRAIGSSTLFSGSATLTVDVGIAAPPPPPPPPPPAPPPPPPPNSPNVQINGSSNPVTVAGGAAIAATVSNGPGNPADWLGVYAVGSPNGPGTPSRGNGCRRMERARHPRHRAELLPVPFISWCRRRQGNMRSGFSSTTVLMSLRRAPR
jgi:hypothetical protein